MKYSALIGSPTDHSVSPLLYRELIKSAKLHVNYDHIKINVDSDRLRDSLAALELLGFIGVSVTLPHKVDVIQYLDELDPSIEQIGAVNTIKLSKNSKGYNTDWLGIYNSIKRFGNKQQHKTATIFGSGGAARAAIYALKELGVEDIRLLYRPNPNDNKLATLMTSRAKYGIRLYEYSTVAKNVDDSDLIINATPAGMIGKESFPFAIHDLDDIKLTDKLYFDAVFNPLDTPLLRYFRGRGAKTIDGLWMMIYQGIKALTIWLDQPIDVSPKDLDRIHGLLTRELKNV